jgi:hypothetical protein
MLFVGDSEHLRERWARGEGPPFADAGGPTEWRNCDGGLLADGEAPAGMIKPPMRDMTPVVFTREAFEKNSHGVALVRCIVELNGTLSSCRIVKGIPYMNEAILESMLHWSYDGPVLFCGHPQRVEMVIPLRVPAPRPAPPPASAPSL